MRFYHRSNDAVFIGAWALLLLLPLCLVGGQILFTRYFWFDESTVQLLVGDPSLIHSLKALRAGATHNGPIPFLILRFLSSLNLAKPEILFRSYSFLSLFLATLAVFKSLRGRYSPLPASLAAVGLYSQERWIYFLFDARYYGPWLAATSWYCYFLIKQKKSTLTRLEQIGLALSSFLSITLHYYGAFAWGLTTLAAFYRTSEKPMRTKLLCLGPAVLGLALNLPFLIGQLHSLGDWGMSTSHSWSQGMPLSHIKGYLGTLLVRPYFCGLLFIALLTYSWKNRREEFRNTLKEFAPYCILIVLPLLLIALSFLCLPPPQFGYAIPATLALAPLSAFLMAPLKPRWFALIAIIFMGLNTRELSISASQARKLNQYFDSLIAALHQSDPRIPIIDATGLLQLPLGNYAPELRARLFYQDYTSKEEGCRARQGSLGIYSQRVVSLYYSELPMLRVETLDTLNQVIVLGKISEADLLSGGCYSKFHLEQIPGYAFLNRMENSKEKTRGQKHSSISSRQSAGFAWGG